MKKSTRHLLGAGWCLLAQAALAQPWDPGRVPSAEPEPMPTAPRRWQEPYATIYVNLSNSRQPDLADNTMPPCAHEEPNTCPDRILAPDEAPPAEGPEKITTWNEAFEDAAKEWAMLTPFLFNVLPDGHANPCLYRGGSPAPDTSASPVLSAVVFGDTVCGDLFPRQRDAQGQGIPGTAELPAVTMFTMEGNTIVAAGTVFNARDYQWDVYGGAAATGAKFLDFRRIALREQGIIIGLQVGGYSPSILNLGEYPNLFQLPEHPAALDIQTVWEIYGYGSMPSAVPPRPSLPSGSKPAMNPYPGLPSGPPYDLPSYNPPFMAIRPGGQGGGSINICYSSNGRRVPCTQVAEGVCALFGGDLVPCDAIAETQKRQAKAARLWRLYPPVTEGKGPR